MITRNTSYIAAIAAEIDSHVDSWESADSCIDQLDVIESMLGNGLLRVDSYERVMGELALARNVWRLRQTALTSAKIELLEILNHEMSCAGVTQHETSAATYTRDDEMAKAIRYRKLPEHGDTSSHYVLDYLALDIAAEDANHRPPAFVHVEVDEIPF